MMKLTDDEMAYHSRLVAQVRAAQAAGVAWEHWSAHLREKYEIGDRDTITEDGTIKRAFVPLPPPIE